MGVREEVGMGPVGLDTVAFIYLIEEHPRYLAIVEPLFEAIDRGEVEGVTSTLTLLEVLVQPYRVGDTELADRYERVLSMGRNLALVEIDRAQLRAAALIRARSRIRTPEAIQLAAALSRHCPVFVTNDREPPPVPGIRRIRIDDHV